MTSRDRVKAAIERRPVDRIPYFMWFHPDTVKLLSKTLEIPEDGVETVFGNDVRQTWVNNNYAMEGVVHDCDGEGHTDAWGISWIRNYGFNQIDHYPLRGKSREEVLDYRFPEDMINELMTPMGHIASAPGTWYLGCDVSPCAFEMYWRLRGMDDALMDFAIDEDLAVEMVSRCVDFADTLSDQAMKRYDLDWLWTGDDVASQGGMIISPDQWRRTVKPHLKRLFARAVNAGLPVAYHCCGALRPIIPDLIEIGCTVLNPIQVGCPGMDPRSLKTDFGTELTFMGGVDTQELLPRGTPDQVREATEELVDVMTDDGGGYILAASHSIPPETPLENLFALYEAVGMTKEHIFDAASDFRSSK